jgi:hypothetical protein
MRYLGCLLRASSLRASRASAARGGPLPSWLGCLLVLAAAGCTSDLEQPEHGSIKVEVISVDDNAPPTLDAPLPANLGDRLERWRFTASVLDPEGNLDTGFNGFARVSVVPGAVDVLEGPAAVGRNVRFTAGVAEAEADVTSMFGPARLWIEDIGYVPAEPGQTPLCSNGIDDDDDVVNDFPNDPGCAFANDMSEEEAQLLTGISTAVHYALPTVADVQGRSSETPFLAVAVQIATRRPSDVIVTRVSSSGFFVTDLAEQDTGFNHMFAFNFNTPVGMRVCNRLSGLSGTASEFFGFTEISFPSYEIGRVDTLAEQSCRRDSDCAAGDFCERLDFEVVGVCQRCLVPEPTVLENDVIISDAEMEKLESGLVRVEQMRIAPNFGPGVPAKNGDLYAFTPNASNCDLNLDGQIDFLGQDESACANQCSDDPECNEWNSFASRGNYKVARQSVMMQVNTGTVQGFNPLLHKGKTFAAVAGTLRNFSGGSLNWTIETRCSEDLVCNFDDACVDEVVPSAAACITPATEDDNDSGTN